MDRLAKLRAEVDIIDTEIVTLLGRRAELVLQIKEEKEQLNVAKYSPDRENEIMARVKKLGEQGKFPLEALEGVFRAIVNATRSLMG